MSGNTEHEGPPPNSAEGDEKGEEVTVKVEPEETPDDRSASVSFNLEAGQASTVEVKEEKEIKVEKDSGGSQPMSQDSACFVTPTVPPIIVKTEEDISDMEDMIHSTSRNSSAVNTSHREERSSLNRTGPDLIVADDRMNETTEIVRRDVEDDLLGVVENDLQVEKNTERVLGDLDDLDEGDESLIMDFSYSNEDELLNDSSSSVVNEGDATRMVISDKDNADLPDQTEATQRLETGALENLNTERIEDSDIEALENNVNTERIEDTNDIGYTRDNESGSDDESLGERIVPVLSKSKNRKNSSSDDDSDGTVYSNVSRSRVTISSSDEDSNPAIVPVVINSSEAFENVLSDLFAQNPRYACISKKSRMKTLLDTGDLSDTTFVVGDTGVVIKAHKYVLHDKSEFFTALFSERWTDSGARAGRIQIPDSEPDDFRSFLEYLYCGETELREENALPLLYLARMYGIPVLCQRTVNFLMANMNADTAMPVFTSLVSFCDDSDRDALRLTDAAADYIALNAMEVFNSSSRLDCKVSDLARVLKLKEQDIRHTNELQIFLVCFKLAQDECKKRGLEPSGPNCRQIMEPAMKYIRLPLLKTSEFSEVDVTNVLTPEEKSALYGYISATLDIRFSEKANLLKQYFNLRPRCTTEFSCKRFKEIKTRAKSWVFGRRRNKPDRISFKASTDIILRAIGLFGSADRIDSRRCHYEIAISVAYHEDLNRSILTTVTDADDGIDSRNGRLFKVPLFKPVHLLAGVMYTISLEVPEGDRTFFGMGGQEEVLVDCQNYQVKFVFEEARQRLLDNGTGVTIGQIPVLYFSLGKESQNSEVQIID